MEILIFTVTFVISAGFLSFTLITRTELRALRDTMLVSDERRAAEEQANAIAAAAAPPVKLVKKPDGEDEVEDEDEEEPGEEQGEGQEDGDQDDDEEAEEAAEEEEPVDETVDSFRQAKVEILKFLEGSITSFMQSGAKLNAIGKFGCHLFLAGASESIGRMHSLSNKEFVKILEACMAVLGSGPEVAQKFGEKYDEYLLEPNYAKMFRAGGVAMERFTSGDATAGNALAPALEEFHSPDAQGKESVIAVMFTDIVGSTKMTQTLGDEGAQRMVRLHNTVVRNALREHRGTEVKHTGDGIMASFNSCPDASTCGIAIQKTLAAARAKDPDGTVLHLRVGINAGQPIAEDGDLSGTTVQIAAIICDKADTDGVFVSSSVQQHSAGSGVSLEDRGAFQLKGLSEPATLYAVKF